MNDKKSCETCRHADSRASQEPCRNCRNGNPPADAMAFDLLWEAAEEERVFEPGEVVLYGLAEYKVLSVCETDGVKMLEVLKIDVNSGNSGEFVLSRHMIPASQCGKQLKELSAREYLERIRAHLKMSGDVDPKVLWCHKIRCSQCAFSTGNNCECSMVLLDPDAALERIRNFEEARKPAEPKKKTYLDDFREKFPRAEFNKELEIPKTCRAYAYSTTEETTRFCNKNSASSCVKCWNEVMPEEEQG